MQDKLFRKVALDRLSSPEQLDQLLQVTTPRSWLAVIALLAVLVVIAVWGIFGTIEVTVDGSGALMKDTEGGDGALKAVIYVPLIEAPKIEVGDKVHLLPAQMQGKDYLLGIVSEIENVPANDADKTTVFGSLDLAQSMAPQGVTVEITIALEREANGAYRWLRGTASQGALVAGMPVSATITVAQVRPIDRVLPSSGDLFAHKQGGR